MTVYVDDLVYWRHTKRSWCHCASDLPGDAGLQELHALADKIGAKREWFQNRLYLPHYDLQPRLRSLAILCGAIAVDGIELVRKCSTAPYLKK